MTVAACSGFLRQAEKMEGGCLRMFSLPTPTACPKVHSQKHTRKLFNNLILNKSRNIDIWLINDLFTPQAPKLHHILVHANLFSWFSCVGQGDLDKRVQCAGGEMPSDSVWRCPRTVSRPDGAV